MGEWPSLASRTAIQVKTFFRLGQKMLTLVDISFSSKILNTAPFSDPHNNLQFSSLVAVLVTLLLLHIWVSDCQT